MTAPGDGDGDGVARGTGRGDVRGTGPDDFWSGDFTLRREPADERGAAAAPPSAEQLAGSGLTVGGRDLAQLLAPVYRALTG